MRVLVLCYVFPPGIGGLERASLSLARMLADRGHDVVVATPDAEVWQGEGSENFSVTRHPSPLRIMKLLGWCDVTVVNNPTLRMQWPLIVRHRPYIAVLHAAIESSTRKLRLVRRVKVWTLRRASAVVAVSSALAASSKVPAVVIPNVLEPSVSLSSGSSAREEHSVVFVGRLVKQKGVDVLLDAAHILRQQGLPVQLTIVGGGPEQTQLQMQASRLGITSCVRFAGWLAADEVAELLRRNLIFVMPSLPVEAFGLSALEAVAQGCVPVVTASGGPPEAIGNCGLVVEPGDCVALAQAMRRLLLEATLREELMQGREAHLALFSSTAVGEQYDRLLGAIRREAH